MYLIKSAVFAYASSSIGLLILYVCLKSKINKVLVKKLFLLLFLCIVISFLSPNVIINIIMSFFVVPVFAKKSSEIAPVFVFYFLVMPAVLFPINVGGVYFFDWYNYYSLTTGALFYSIFKTNSKVTGSLVSIISIVLITMIYFVIGIRGTSVTNAIRVIVDLFCVIALPFFLVRRSINSLDDVKLLFLGIVSATASLSSLAIYEARTSWPIYSSLSSHYGSMISGGNSVKIRGGLLRSAGPFTEPTSFALWLALGTFLAIVSKWMFKSNAYRAFFIIFSLYGLVCPQSRGAILGLVCAFLFYALVNSGLVKAIKGIAVCLLAVLTLYVAGLAIPVVGSMLGLNSNGNITRDYREDLFSRGIEESHNHPFIGQSVPDVMTALADLKQGEGIVDFVNTYLFILLTTGYIGLIVFVFAIVINITTLTKSNRKLKRYGINAASSISSILFSISIMLIFTSMGGRTTAGLSIFIAVAGYLHVIPLWQLRVGNKFPYKRKINLVEDSKIESERYKKTRLPGFITH